MALLLFFAFLAGLPADERLKQCLEQKDRACVARILATPPATDSVEELVLAARGYMFLQRNVEAAAAIDRALQIEPGDYALLMERGWICQRSGDQPSAIHSFLLAAKAKPASPEVFYELGMSFFFAREFARASKHFEHALALDPANDRAAFMLGVVSIWSEQIEQAEPYFSQAVNLQPDNPHYLLHYGVLLAKEGRNERALELMLRSEKLDPRNPLTHFNIGRVLKSQGKLTDARAELETAVKQRPDFSAALYQLAGVYRQLGDQARARRTLEHFQTASAAEKNAEQDPIDAALSQ